MGQQVQVRIEHGVSTREMEAPGLTQRVTRHYSCEVRQNLTGQWVVLRRWGRVSAKQGQSLEHLCDRYEQGPEILSAGWETAGETWLQCLVNWAMI